MQARLLLGVLSFCTTMAATAQGQVAYRTIVEGGASSWKHEKSGVELPARVLGLTRSAVQDSTEGNQLDVFVRYEGGSSEGLVTIYLYRPAIMNVPLWFDRSHTALRLHQPVGEIKPATIFAPPGRKTASAMRVSYALPGGVDATALALVPAGDWLLKFRLTGPGTQQELDEKLDWILSAMRLPDGPEAPAADEIRPCTEPMSFQDAKALPPDGTRALLMSLIVRARYAKGATEVWCRDGSSEAVWGLYRKANASDGYVLALLDSGRMLQVEAAPAHEEGRQPDFSLTFADMAQIEQYPQLSALPSPQQAVKFAETLEPVARIFRDSNQIDLLTDRLFPED